MAQQNQGGSKEQIPVLTARELTFATSEGAMDPCSNALLEQELAFLENRPEGTGHKRGEGDDPGSLMGIALSGGGIRSATFSLGVLQALAKNCLLEKMDYLSTVSGGGYIGASLTWWLSGKAGREGFGTGQRDFPYGSDDPSAPDDTAGTGQARGPSTNTPLRHAQAAILKYLRQHGNYLAPGGGITMMSGIAVVLCGILLNFLVWLPIAAAVMVLFHLPGNIAEFSNDPPFAQIREFLELLPDDPDRVPVVFGLFLLAAAALAFLFLIASVIYSLLTYFSRSGTAWWYKARRFFQSLAGRNLRLIGIFFLVGTIPLVDNALRGWVESVGVGAALSGVLSGLWSFRKTGEDSGGRVPPSLIAPVGAALLIYGLLLIAYGWAHWTYQAGDSWVWAAFLAVTGLAVITGAVVNLNYISLHRYYRDRLMEAFLPDFALAETGRTGAAMGADKARLHEFAQPGALPGPYHIVNTNVVLVDSEDRTLRARGGGNFILTPLFCGSNATGWKGTKDFMNGKMTLSTAMAISGAALNPNTGVGGIGITRNSLVSLLMALLNLRLGYWVPNIRQKWISQTSPNHFVPGLYELGRLGYRETRRFLQLSDGGHFENTGLYELIRRRLRLIILCDAGADPKFTFSDLQTAFRRIAADFGARVKFEADYQPESLIPLEDVAYPQKTKVARRGHIRGKITYADGTQGDLIVIKTTMIPGLQLEVKGYKGANPYFPDQSTLDQFFDERQFEAYRELGYRTATAMIKDDGLADLIQLIRS